MTTEQDPRLTRAAQLRADAAVMRQAAEVRERNSWMSHSPTSLLGSASDLESAAAAIEKEVQAEIDAKAAEPVDEWAGARRVVDHILSNRSQYLSSEICVAKYVRHLRARVAELENDECERINDRIAALDAEIAELRAENGGLRNENVQLKRSEARNESISRKQEHFDLAVNMFGRTGCPQSHLITEYAQAAVHYRRKYREAEAKLAAVPKLWMTRSSFTKEIVAHSPSGNPAVFLDKKDAEAPNSDWFTAIPYDGRKSVAP